MAVLGLLVIAGSGCGSYDRGDAGEPSRDADGSRDAGRGFDAGPDGATLDAGRDAAAGPGVDAAAGPSLDAAADASADASARPLDAATDAAMDAAAMDAEPGGADASSPDAFVCRPEGASCAAAADCCSGVCLPTANSMSAFSNRMRCRAASDPTSCLADDAECVLDTDCCSGQCMANVCKPQPTECVPNLGSCSDDTDCCAGDFCNISGSIGIRTRACLQRQLGAALPVGAGCFFHAQCASGICRAPSAGRPLECAEAGSGCDGIGFTCSTHSDCCSRFCDPVFRECRSRGGPCDSSTQCLGSCDESTMWLCQ